MGRLREKNDILQNLLKGLAAGVKNLLATEILPSRLIALFKEVTFSCL